MRYLRRFVASFLVFHTLTWPTMRFSRLSDNEKDFGLGRSVQ